MASVDIRIPQLGEGLQEARIVRFLKNPGETILRDEPIFEMETDKAVMEIESPAEGTLAAWTAKEDQVLPIGAVIGSIEAGAPAPQETPTSVQDAITESYSPDQDTASGPAPAIGTPPPESDVDSQKLLRNQFISPRARAHAKEKGLSDQELAQLAQSTDGRLLPEAIDRYLAGGRSTQAPTEATPSPSSDGTGYQDLPLSQRQRTLVYRLQRATKDVIPATMEMRVEWSGVEVVRAQMKNADGPLGETTQFLLFAYCVAQSARNFPQFRSALLNDATVRVFDHLHLGIAVALPEDELLMARVENADSLSLEEFTAAAQSGIRKAREGMDQTTDTMQLSLTNMSAAGVRLGIPVIAAPAVATLFVGEAFDDPYPIPGGGIGFRRMCNLVLSFDHRVANGIGAAKFLSEVRSRVESLREHFPAQTG